MEQPREFSISKETLMTHESTRQMSNDLKPQTLESRTEAQNTSPTNTQNPTPSHLEQATKSVAWSIVGPVPTRCQLRNLIGPGASASPLLIIEWKASWFSTKLPRKRKWGMAKAEGGALEWNNVWHTKVWCTVAKEWTNDKRRATMKWFGDFW